MTLDQQAQCKSTGTQGILQGHRYCSNYKYKDIGTVGIMHRGNMASEWHQYYRNSAGALRQKE